MFFELDEADVDSNWCVQVGTRTLDVAGDPSDEVSDDLLVHVEGYPVTNYSVLFFDEAE